MAGKRGLWITAVAVAAVGLAVLAFTTVPTLRHSLATFGHLNWAWLPLALLAESGSMAAFARSQRHLLRVGGTHVPLRSAMAITYASNALSVSLPMVGAGLGTAFTYRQLRRHGADSAVVGWVLTVSGVVSSLSFAVITTVGALICTSSGEAAIGFLVAAAGALPMVALLLALRFAGVRRLLNRLLGAAVRLSRRLFHRPRADAADGFDEVLTRIGGLRATPRQYGIALFFSLRNWGADCLCLVCAIAAAGGPVPWRGLVVAYCLGVTAGSAGLTPGGIGIVEATLTAALVSAGMATRRAVPAVLLYRLASLWLVIAVGGAIALVLSRRAAAPRARRRPMR